MKPVRNEFYVTAESMFCMGFDYMRARRNRWSLYACKSGMDYLNTNIKRSNWNIRWTNIESRERKKDWNYKASWNDIKKKKKNVYLSDPISWKKSAIKRFLRHLRRDFRKQSSLISWTRPSRFIISFFPRFIDYTIGLRAFCGTKRFVIAMMATVAQSGVPCQNGTQGYSLFVRWLMTDSFEQRDRI